MESINCDEGKHARQDGVKAAVRVVLSKSKSFSAESVQCPSSKKLPSKDIKSIQKQTLKRKNSFIRLTAKLLAEELFNLQQTRLAMGIPI